MQKNILKTFPQAEVITPMYQKYIFTEPRVSFTAYLTHKEYHISIIGHHFASDFHALI